MPDAPSLTPRDVAAVIARLTGPDGCHNGRESVALRREIATAFAARFAEKSGAGFNRPAFMRAACPRF